MARLKHLLVAASVLIVLAGAIALFPPAPSHSQGTTPAGFPVEVVNTTDKPLPTTARGTTTVAGTVGLAADAKVGIDPANSNVNIVNTPNVGLSANGNTVRVNSTATTPVFIANVNDGAREPFQAQATVTMSDNATTGTARFVFANNSQTVPAGKRLVIENVSARATLPSGFGGVAHILTRVNNQDSPHFLVLNTQSFSPVGFDRVTTNQLVRVYADPGTQVAAVVNLDFGLPFGTGNLQILNVTISGYLVNVP